MDWEDETEEDYNRYMKNLGKLFLGFMLGVVIGLVVFL